MVKKTYRYPINHEFVFTTADKIKIHFLHQASYDAIRNDFNRVASKEKRTMGR